MHQEALALADPVPLHDANLVWPFIQGIQTAEQVVGVVGDLEEPLRQFLLLNERAGPPAPAVDHLLVGENGMIDRVPIYLAFLAIDEPRIIES